MKDRLKPEEPEADFVELIRRTRGPCPEIEDLVAFHRGDMAPERAEVIARHIRLCGTCQIAAEMLTRSEESAGMALPESAEAKSSLNRMRIRFERFLRDQQESPVEKQSVLEWLRRVQPVLAYALVVALLYPAYLGLRRTALPAPSPPSPPTVIDRALPDIQDIQPFDLEPVERAAGIAPPALKPDPRQRYLALSFLVPTNTGSTGRYEITLRDERGVQLAFEPDARPLDSLGRFVVICRSELFKPGSYLLTVNDRIRDSGALRRSFQFSFKIEP